MVKRLTVGTCGAVLVLGLLVAGCTPEPGPTPSVTPEPSVTSPTPSPTATENAQERQQRLDFEAAERAYLTANAETERLAAGGGAKKPTRVLLENASGAYLDVQMDGLRTLKDEGWRTDRQGIVSVTRSGGWSSEELSLTACEDSSAVRLINANGKEVEKDRPRRFSQQLTARRIGGHWKISDVESTVVKVSESHSGCS